MMFRWVIALVLTQSWLRETNPRVCTCLYVLLLTSLTEPSSDYPFWPSFQLSEPIQISQKSGYEI